MDTREQGDTWMIGGVSPENTLLEIEMLLKPSAANFMDAFPREIPGVKEKTLSANSSYSTTYSIFSLLVYGLKASVFLLPLLLAFVYYRYGRERSFTVPGFLSYVPHPRKPWIVNLVFRRDPLDFDENGFYATLL